MRFKQYLNENNDIFKLTVPRNYYLMLDAIKQKLLKISYNEFKNKCKSSYDIIKNIIDIDYIKKKFNLNENIDLNEDVKHWWELIKSEAFPTLAFYPALQVWLEIDKMVKGTPYSGNVLCFYAAFWLILVTGKYIIGWNAWKKENPTEYNKEREIGKGGIF
jgi:hypothetical protein